MQKQTNKSKLTKKNVAKFTKKELKTVKNEAVAGTKAVATKAKELSKKATTYDWKNFKTDFKGMFKNFVQSIIHPTKQFDEIQETGNYDKEVVKTGIYGVIGALIILCASLIMGTFGISTILKLIYVPIGAIMFLFAFAGFVNMFSYYCKGSVNFEMAFKATAEKIYLLPLIILLNILSFGYVILFITSLIVDFYILYMVYAFVLYGSKGHKNLTKTVFAVFGLLLLLAYFTRHVDLWLALKNPQVVFESIFMGF